MSSGLLANRVREETQYNSAVSISTGTGKQRWRNGIFLSLPFPIDLYKINSVDIINQTAKQIRTSIFCLSWHKNCWTGEKTKLSLALSALSWGSVLLSSKGCHWLLCSLSQLFLCSFSSDLTRRWRNVALDHRKLLIALNFKIFFLSMSSWAPDRGRE